VLFLLHTAVVKFKKPKIKSWGWKMDSAQLAQIKDSKGFIAALDQSGGSTPKALS
jgi:hypothetical protein